MVCGHVLDESFRREVAVCHRVLHCPANLTCSEALPSQWSIGRGHSPALRPRWPMGSRDIRVLVAVRALHCRTTALAIDSARNLHVVNVIIVALKGMVAWNVTIETARTGEH